VDSEKIPIECREINTLVKGLPDDLLICSGSPEVRCLGITKKLARDYTAKKVLLLRYSGHISEERERNIQEIVKSLENVGPIEEIIIDEEKPIPRIKEIISEIENLVSKPNPRISIDITTIIKWHLLLLLESLDRCKLATTCRYLYTEPEDYMTDVFQPLSFGINKVFPVPTYSGNFDFYKDLQLVLMLGYEGDRALAIFDEMDPDDCLLLIAKPAYREKSWEGRTERLNKEIINLVGKSKIRYIDARNPITVRQQLEKLLNNQDAKGYNQAIAPLGTKPQTLGLFTYLRNKPANTIVVYGSPARHNKFYSQGIGRSWILPFQ
jgi:hypothetical protein